MALDWSLAQEPRPVPADVKRLHATNLWQDGHYVSRESKPATSTLTRSPILQA
jgi:hypothetical protein